MNKGIFENGRDDFMFPTTFEGMKQSGMILESGCPSVDTSVVNKDDVDVERAGDTVVTESAKCDGKKCDKKDEQVNESAESKVGVLEAAVSEMAEQNARGRAMSALLTWVSEGSFDYDTLDAMIIGASDLDEDMEVSEEEEDFYNEVWGYVPEAISVLGGNTEDANALFNGPSEEADKAAARLGSSLTDALNEQKADDNEIVIGFSLGGKVMESVGESAVGAILEATYRMKKVVRDGVVQKIRKRISGHVKLSAEKRMGLKKAQRKAHTATANLHRAKSFKIGQRRGLHK